MDEEPAQGQQLQEHGGVEDGDCQALNPEDGRQPVLEKSGGVHTQEAGSGHSEGGRGHLILVCMEQ